MFLDYNAVHGTYAQHLTFCEAVGITPQNELSFTHVPKRSCVNHLVYWILRNNGYENIEAEKEVTRLERSELVVLVK